MKKPAILMIDDDPVFLEGYASLLGHDYQVHGATDAATGLRLIEKVQPMALLLDITLKTEKEGLAVLPRFKKQFPQLPIVVVTNWDSHLIFREALALGADDFFVKSDHVQNLYSILKNLLVRNQVAEEEANEFPIAYSHAFRQVLRDARKVARSQCNVLIAGETGVGKEVVARFIHQHSPRRNGPFVAVNCGAVVESLLASELFGHERGAFTGAYHTKVGKFEVASGGTLFLDEIEELPIACQPALLRVLQDREIERLGGTRKIPVDVRIIAATQSELKELIAKGRFREDLYQRLAVYPIHIPPLRQREDDIVPLCHYFLHDFLKKHKTCEKRLTQSALIMLTTYPWPGNVRELQNVLERAVIRSEGRDIRPADLLLEDFPAEAGNLPYDLAKMRVVMEFQRNYIKAALCRHRGNISLTARDIGVSRQGLMKMMRDLHLAARPERDQAG